MKSEHAKANRDPSTGPRKNRGPGLPPSRAPLPPQRYMTIIAQDPVVKRKNGKVLMARIAVPAEDLLPGPIGYRVQVVDYDATKQQYHGSHSLPPEYVREPPAWQKGDPRIIIDFRFHAQNVYALVMKTLARFEFALGRRLGWSFGSHQLKVAPHGMLDANAFYSPYQEGLVFGYFQGMSGAPVYTGLSHDIVVHETTHALLDGLRERYLDPSNPDQAAFHEGFADVIALLSVFSLPEVVTHLLGSEVLTGASPSLIGRDQVTANALRESALFGLADEMGQEIEGLRGSALRRSAELAPDPDILSSREYFEAHRRGEVFVAAVLNGFINAWAQRIQTSGVKGQRKYPLARVAEEGADIADALVTMWIRALDYMPPVHLQFGDALSAALTADLEVRPDDSRYQLRFHMVDRFKAYGINPSSTRKDAFGIWNPPPENLRYERVRFESMRSDKDEVFRFLWENRDALELRAGAYTEVLSVRPCVRTGIDGFVLRETVAEYYQVARLIPAELKEAGVRVPASYLASLRKLRETRRRSHRSEIPERRAQPSEAIDDEGGITTPLYGGGILVFDDYGRLKYWVHNDVFGSKQEGRLEYLWNAGLLEANADRARYKAARLSTLHRLRATNARRIPSEGW